MRAGQEALEKNERSSPPGELGQGKQRNGVQSKVSQLRAGNSPSANTQGGGGRQEGTGAFIGEVKVRGGRKRKTTERRGKAGRKGTHKNSNISYRL